MRGILVALLLAGPCLCLGDDDETVIEIDGKPGPDEGTGDEPAESRPPPKRDEERAEPVAPLQERINVAIERGVRWLKERQLEDGSYGPCVAGGYYGGGTGGDLTCFRVGPTAFTVFTLRKCGVPRKDPTIRSAERWLRSVCREGWNPDHPKTPDTQFQGDGVYRYTSYESSAIIMMLVALNEKDHDPREKERPVHMSRAPDRPVRGWKRDDWEWMHERVQFLIKNPHSRMPPVQIRGGGWRYWPPYHEADQDLSATQFALLGLREAVRAGYPVHLVEPNTWEWAANAAASLQLDTGAFSYQKTTPWTAGMTAAGIASLLICKEQMANLSQPVPAWIDQRVEAGLEFLGKHLDFTQNTHGPVKGDHEPDGTGYHYYHLYGIERVGALAGKREIGGKAWYPRGAEWLVGQQADTCAWTDPTCMNPPDVLGTCFALLFLKKATPPVVTMSGD